MLTVSRGEAVVVVDRERSSNRGARRGSRGRQSIDRVGIRNGWNGIPNSFEGTHGIFLLFKLFCVRSASRTEMVVDVGGFVKLLLNEMG